jgi:hypothetical protein
MDEQHSHEVEFIVIDDHADFGNEELKNPRNTGTLIDLDSSGTGMLTHVPLQPGDMVRLGLGDASKTGVIMWSVESSNKFRVQMRFV